MRLLPDALGSHNPSHFNDSGIDIIWLSRLGHIKHLFFEHHSTFANVIFFLGCYYWNWTNFIKRYELSLDANLPIAIWLQRLDSNQWDADFKGRCLTTWLRCNFGGEGWIWTTASFEDDLQSPGVDHCPTSPFNILASDALPLELHQITISL